MSFIFPCVIVLLSTSDKSIHHTAVMSHQIDFIWIVVYNLGVKRFIPRAALRSLERLSDGFQELQIAEQRGLFHVNKPCIWLHHN